LIKKNEIKNEEIIRKDYIAITIALDISDDNFIWITYDKYKEVFNSILNKEKEINNINKMTDLLEKLDLKIKMMNHLITFLLKITMMK